MKRSCLLLLLALTATTAPAQDRPAPIVSPEVSPDRMVTFRLKAPAAREVSVNGDFGKGGPLTKDDAGVWSATFGPLEPDLYSYGFVVDGTRVLDGSNTAIKPQRAVSVNVLKIRGETPAIWEERPGVARGTVHLHDYESKAVGVTRRLRVYTPPSYETDKEARFPVLYLFHGSGDNEATWTEFGRAQIILDNLIAAGQARPMVMVMTDGHAAAPLPRDSTDDAARARAASSFERDLLEDVIPLAEAHYRLRPEREMHAIIGLSMGGNQSLVIGLNHLDRFAWVGGMSSAVRNPEKSLANFFADPAPAAAPLRLLWIACGKDDFLLKENQHFDALLTEKKIVHTYRETGGSHAWPVWRRYLAEFAPLLFTDAKTP